jgi:hypothetical protein
MLGTEILGKVVEVPDDVRLDEVNTIISQALDPSRASLSFETDDGMAHVATRYIVAGEVIRR